jgi:hypothetical protein
VAVAQGRLDDARALLDEGLDFSLQAHGTHGVTLCLAAFARLAFVEGDPERAALLAGAAEGLRRRVGLRAWPTLRRGRPSCWPRSARRWGADRFDEVFVPAPGSPSARRWPPSGNGAARRPSERWQRHASTTCSARRRCRFRPIRKFADRDHANIVSWTELDRGSHPQVKERPPQHVILTIPDRSTPLLL